MPMKKPYVILLLATAVALLTLGCARPGTPDGGPYDETPPKVVGAKPNEGAVNSRSNNIEIFFDEYVKLEKAAEKIVISPPQINMPEISAIGRKIKVKLLDSLKQNTTYTIDFGDAIVDYNEGNPMGKYTYTFSTGEKLDTMEISGKVLDARNLEPVKVLWWDCMPTRPTRLLPPNLLIAWRAPTVAVNLPSKVLLPAAIASMHSRMPMAIMLSIRRAR